MPVHHKDKKKETLAIIDSALTILEKLPKLDETNSSLSVNITANPIQFIMDLFKSTAGYDAIIKILSGFIYGFTPYLEYSVKTILIANMKNLLSCSLDFRISDDIIRDGIAFDARTLDIMNILSYSPLDVMKPFSPLREQIGRYYYFDIDDVNIPEDLLKCKDFNAFLWYIINKSNKREVWNKTDERNDENKKDSKKNGTITLEYHNRSSSMTNSKGVNDVLIQTPIYNCVHVFLGNTEPTNISGINEDLESIKTNSLKISDSKLKIHNFNVQNNDIIEKKYNLEDEFNNGKITENDYISSINKCDDRITYNDEQIKTNENFIHSLQDEIILRRNKIKSFNYTYNDIEKNYYYGKTIIEFNYDYIMSLQIFDSKTLAAQLIDALTGCLSINLNLSYEQLLLKFEVKKIINEIITTDHAAVSDCFFTFSNDEYNDMLSKAEKYRNGTLSFKGENNSGAKVNAEDILSGLNNINKDSTQEEIKTIIEDTITNLSKELSKVDYSSTSNVNAGVRMNIIENLLNELAFVLAANILSPKIYLLLAINLKLMENKSEFDLRGFIELFKQFIVKIIREVVDLLLKYMVDELMKLIGVIAKEIAVELTIEQAEYYYNLMNRLIDCFKRRNILLDFNIDNVDYADIISSEETEPENNIC